MFGCERHARQTSDLHAERKTTLSYRQGGIENLILREIYLGGMKI